MLPQGALRSASLHASFLAVAAAGRDGIVCLSCSGEMFSRGIGGVGAVRDFPTPCFQ